MASMFIHPLTVERREWDDDPNARDSEGQPDELTPTTTSTMGLVQPRRTGGAASAELDDWRSAGSEVSDHVIFMPPETDLRTDDVVIYGTERYQVVGIRRFRYGGLAHLEVDSRLITPIPMTAGGS